ncbi:MAG TPA: hypothetical protein VK874_13760 [Gaiellaceae bacterium]|nr:hypothetical protein [Gaiellaceae bacterium]
MPVDTPSLFAQVIQDHLALKERNAALERDLPLDRYKTEDPFENHPLFKTEEQARLEETMDGELTAADVAETPPGWPGEEPAEETDSGLWSRSRDFDWGD